MKYGKKQFAVDENKRDTYRFWSASGDGPSNFAALGGERKQLMVVRMKEAFGFSFFCLPALNEK